MINDDAAFLTETNSHEVRRRRGAVDLTAVAKIALAQERYNSGSLQGNAVAPKSAPIWMTSLPFVYYERPQGNNDEASAGLQRETTAAGDLVPLAGGGASKHRTTGKEPFIPATEKHEPITPKFLIRWLTKPNPSLFLFREENIIRSAAQRVVALKAFEYLVIAAIMCNVIVMTLQVSLPRNDQSQMNIILDRTELPFIIFFTVEAGLKIIAMGFVLNRGSYLRSFWNILDFIVVIAGWLTLFLTEVDLSILRTLRILRPLKLATRIRPLQVILTAIITAMAPLSQIALILLFVITIFAIIGMQFYLGIFHWTCFNKESESISDNEPKPCAADGTNYGRGSHMCEPENTTCRRYWIGPNEGLTSFDNIGSAILTVFICVTTEGWTDLMYICDGVYGRSFNWLYFCALIVVGTFFMLNLVLGVLSAEFAKERGRVEKRRQYLRRHRQEIFQREVSSYLEWITTAENILLNDPDVSMEMKLRVIQVRKENDARAKKKGDGDPLTRLRTTVTSMSSSPSSTAGDSANNDDVFSQNGETEENLREEAEREKKEEAKKEAMKNQPLIVRMRRVAKTFIKSQVFFWLVIIFVVINAISLGLEFYNQPTWLDLALHNIAIILAVIFTLEILIKIFALGFFTFFRSSQNIFETIIIIGSVVELILTTVNPKWSVGIAVLRCFRLLRIFKLTRYWPLLTQFITSVTGSLKSIASLLVFLLLFLIIFALLGMELFGGQYNFPEGRPAFNFDTFPSAIITSFQITTAKDWPQRMIDGVKSKGGIQNGGMAFVPYFVVMVLAGTYTLLNLFLAIAVDSIASNDEVELTADGSLKRRSTGADDDLMIDDESPVASEYSNENDDADDEDEDEAGDEATNRKQAKPAAMETTAEKRSRKTQSDLINMPPHSSFFIFKTENFFRYVCFKLVSDPVFDYLVLSTICASTVALAAEDPVDAKAYSNIPLTFFDYAFTAIFTIELILKMIVLGFVGHPGAYLRDPWNVIDAVVVLSAFVNFILENSGLGSGYGTAIKSLRIIRVLRPLKTVRRIPKLQAVLSCILASLKNVINVLIMFGLFDYIFSCLAIQLFAGKFFYCSDPTMETEIDCQGSYFTFDDGGNVAGVSQREWKKYDLNYDNLAIAMLTLFTVTTGDGWPTIMMHSIEATEINRGPKPGHNPAMAAFYIIYLIICPFFLVNVFVAMIVVTFQQQGEDKEIDKNEKRCIDYVINAKPINVRMPPVEQNFRRRMWRFVESTPFEFFIIAFIFLTTIVMMLKHFDQGAGYDEFENIVNFAGAITFAVEAVLRMYAYGLVGYFKDVWNIFDFFTVTASVADVVISEVNPSLIDIGFLRLFRTVRLIKVMRKVRSIRIILWTFLQSFKALPYVCLLMGMAYFAFAIIGMQLFGSINPLEDSSINDHANFQTFFDALLLLFRITTGEGWPDVMLSCTSGRPCSPYSTSESCGSDVGAYIYFVIFILLATFLLLNLFVAVIMDNFEYLTRDSSILGPHHLDEFVRHWSEYDPNGIGKISLTDMFALVKEMEPPLGFGQNCPTKTAYRKLIRMNIPLVDGKMVRFTTTLFALVRESLKIRVGDVKQMDEMDKDLRQLITKFWPKFAKRKMHLLLPPEEATGFQQLTTGKIYAGLLLLDLWKNGLETEATKYNHNPMQKLVASAHQTALAPILRRNDETTKSEEKAKRELRFSDSTRSNSRGRTTGAATRVLITPSSPTTTETTGIGSEATSPSTPTNLSDIPSSSSSAISQTGITPQIAPLPARLARRGGIPLDLRKTAEDDEKKGSIRSTVTTQPARKAYGPRMTFI